MPNHYHIRLAVPPMAPGGLSDKLLLEQLSALYPEAFVAGVAAKLAEAAKPAEDGRFRSRFLQQACGGGCRG